MLRIRLKGEISRNGKSLKESIAPASNCDSGRQVSEERGPSSYFPAAESESGSCVSNRTNPDFSPSITSVFPATNSETDCRSVFHGTPPKYPQSNSIVLSFPAAKSQTYSSENDEIFQNPSQATATHPYFTMSVSYNGPTPDFSPSIPLFFPPNMSETETGSSESNETPQPFSNSILSFFPPARSQTNSSENDEIIQNPSIASVFDGYVFHTFWRSLSIPCLSSASNFESDLPSPSEWRTLSILHLSSESNFESDLPSPSESRTLSILHLSSESNLESDLPSPSEPRTLSILHLSSVPRRGQLKNQIIKGLIAKFSSQLLDYLVLKGFLY